MRKDIVELFAQKNILLKNLEQLDLGNFTKSRTLTAYFGVNLKGFYTLVFIRDAKARLLSKDAQSLANICDQIQIQKDIMIKKRILFYKSQICSKAAAQLTQIGFKHYDFV